MTREEAIEELERLLSHWDDLENGKRSFQWYSKDAVEVSITSLRPVSRERVEKVWRGCDMCNGIGAYDRYAECLTKTLLAKYCPHCGAPLTDGAVEMVMERMETLNDV